MRHYIVHTRNNGSRPDGTLLLTYSVKRLVAPRADGAFDWEGQTYFNRQDAERELTRKREEELVTHLFRMNQDRLANVFRNMAACCEEGAEHEWEENLGAALADAAKAIEQRHQH